MLPAKRALIAPVVLAFAASAGLTACAPAVEAQPYPSQVPEAGEASPASPEASARPEVGVVSFFDREIDLRPFLSGFAFRNFSASVEHGRLFYLDAGDTYTLRMAEVGDRAAVDLGAGRAVSDSDWSKRSLWGVRYLASRNELWLHADANNDEKMNLWAIDLGDATGKAVAKTDADYVYAFGVSADEKRLAYLPRRGTQAPYTTCVHLLDLESGADRELACDSPELRFTWGNLVFSPDGKELYFNAQVEGDRRRVQILRLELDRAGKKPRPITDTDVRRSSPSLLERWIDGDRLVFTANDDGFRNAYTYSRKRKRITQLTHLREDIQGAALLDEGLFVSHGSPAGSTLELVDLATGEAKVRGAMPGKVGLLGGFGGEAWWTHQAPDVVFELSATRVRRAGVGVQFDSRRLAEPSAEVREAMVQCLAEAVRIETFDQDPATGKTRELHAFLLRPKSPMGGGEADRAGAPPLRQLAMIRSFYGGDNGYNRFDHMMCAAGLTLLSPAVRGSSGFGKDFAALNDRDLGGDEIVDLFYAARWLQARLDLAPEQIGVYGRSHGGYATMRAMTFDPATNGRNESFDFGFGLADAGFSDIVAFHDATNIPDWVVLESGDPAVAEDRERMLARSPLYGVERLRAPIFLLHGDADWRVPVQGSRTFVAAARALDKAVTYREVEGQGHHVEGVARIAADMQARLSFLMAVAQAQREAARL